MRVNGATVKAALLPAARRQLIAVAGADKVNPKAFGATSFSGDGAYTQFFMRNGIVYSWGINYPALPDNSLLTRKEADLMAGYTLHEVGHIAYTDNEALPGGLSPQLFRIWNGLEDPRIEAAMIASGKAVGARSSFKRLMSRHTIGLDAQGFNPTRFGDAAFTLALLGRAAYGNGNGYANRLMDRIPQPKRDLYERAIGSLLQTPLDRTGTAIVLQIARDFLAGWQLLEPAAPSAQQPAPQLPKDEPDDEPADESDGEPLALPSGDQDDESFDLGDDGYDDEPDEGAAAREDFARSAVQDEGPSLESGGESDDGEEGAGDEQLFSDVGNQAGPDRDPELGVDDVFANILNRTPNPIELPTTATPFRSDMSTWSSVLQLTDRQALNAERRLSKVAKSPALKSALARILRAPERTGRDVGSAGKFDPKRFGKMISGSEMVMKQHWTEPGLETAVSIVIDASGSMKGERMKRAIESAWVFAEACEMAGAAVEVVAYQAVFEDTSGSAGRTLDGLWAHDLSATYRCPARIGVVKPFGKRLSRCAATFKVAGTIADGGTPDYTAVRDACQRLGNRTEQRKVVLSVTDGCGDAEAVKRLCGLSQQLYGVDVIGIGIGVGGWAMDRTYTDWISINSVEQLEGAGLKVLARKLEARDTRRKW